jgi:hypothetical protein
MVAGPDALLADPADLAAFLGVPADDPKLLAALRAATRRFRGTVRHPVSLVTEDTVYLDGGGEDRLLLPAAPVVQLRSVLVDGEPLTGVRVKRQAGILLHPQGCWPAWAEITVVYDHGYDPVPEDVAEAVVDQARALYTLHPGLASMTAGGEQLAFGAQAAVGVTAQWTAAVDAYQLNRGDRT